MQFPWLQVPLHPSQTLFLAASSVLLTGFFPLQLCWCPPRRVPRGSTPPAPVSCPVSSPGPLQPRCSGAQPGRDGCRTHPGARAPPAPRPQPWCRGPLRLAWVLITLGHSQQLKPCCFFSAPAATTAAGGRRKRDAGGLGSRACQESSSRAGSSSEEEIPSRSPSLSPNTP